FGISVLAAFFVFTTLKRTKTITKLVDERTQELSEANEKLFIQIEERQLAELNLEQFFSQSLDLLCIASIDGYFKKINPMFSELLGYSSEELLSRPFMDFIHPDDIDETASVMQNLAFGKPPSNFENRFRTISGSYRWFEWKATAAHGGILYAAARDITDARESIKVIARLQRHNELILNSAGDGIYGVDINGVITFVNPAAARMLEVQTGNIVGRIESEIIRYSGHDGTAVPWSKSPVHETLVSGRPRQATEHWVTKSNGDTLPVEFIIAPLVEKDGAIVGAVVTFKEITERQEAEERRLADEAKLRDSESRTKAILDLAVDAIITISDKGKIESANKAAETVFGYTADQMIGNNVSMLMPSPFHEGHDQYLGNYQKTGERKVIGIGREVIGLRSDGSTFPMELSVSEVTLGGHHMYTGIVRDITERKEAEERRQAAEASLRDSESRTKAILDLAVDAIITISDKGKIESANKAAERVFGYTADQMIGNNVSMLMPSPFHEGHDQYLGNYQKTGEKKVIGIGREVIGLRSDGSTFPMELSVSEVTLGGHHMYTGIVRDITERKASEEFIKKSEEAKESLLNAIPDLMFRISGKGKILAYRAAENSDDYVSPGELFVGRSIEEAMPGEFAELAKTKIAATLETQAAQTFEYRMPVPIKSKNFRDFEARVHVSGPDEVLVLIRDISERRAVERMKEEFVSTVSHELRTPLTSIRGALGLLDGTMLVDASKQVKRMLQIGISNTDRLSRLINDILDLERLEAGKTELELEEFLVADLVERTIESLQVLANDAGINLSADIDEMTLVADNDKVTQVLTNLVSNAIKFSEKGQPVNVTATISDEEIKISVIDEGRGIPEDSLDSVFGRFQQIDASDSKQKGGTGLGLAICKGIIELHGGRIWAENNPGPGSKFVFTLPRNASQNDDSSGLENVKAA
ncbi:PAS domain S-box protein, partial [Dehalococcoides mccartyi]|nr:PAS domain S-box protein [Dehalococcoides mccartyi]